MSPCGAETNAPPKGRRAYDDATELIRTGRIAEARQLVRNADPAHRGHLRLLDTWIALLHHAGEADEALDLAVANAEARRDRLAERRRVQRPERPLERGERLFVAGHFYSGSGAVTDFLADHRGLERWSPAGEMRLIKFPGGLDALRASYVREGRLTAEALVELYLHLTGFRIVEAPQGEWHAWRVVNRHSRRLHGKAEARGYLLRGYEAFLGLAGRRAQGPLPEEELTSRLRDWVCAALDAAAADLDADRLVVDQAIPAWRLPAADLVPPSTFVIVHRDPRDQYVEARNALAAPGRRAPSPTRFAGSYVKRRWRAHRLGRRLVAEHGHRVLHGSFERFVMEHTPMAKDLRARLDLEQVPIDGDAFDPAVSRRNVGKHAQELAPTSRRVFETLLGPYLSEHASRR